MVSRHVGLSASAGHSCLMHLRLNGMLQHNHLGLGSVWWMCPYKKLLGPGPRSPQDCTPNVATEHRHVRSDRIRSSLPLSTSDCWLSPG